MTSKLQTSSSLRTWSSGKSLNGHHNTNKKCTLNNCLSKNITTHVIHMGYLTTCNEKK